MRKSLIALILGLSSCVSQQQKCPDDKELLKAGFRIYSASEMMDSQKELDHRLAKSNFHMINDFYFNCEGEELDHRLAKSNFHMINDFYFNCEGDHRDRHYQEAMERASKYFGFNEKDRNKFARNVKRIKEEIEFVSYKR